MSTHAHEFESLGPPSEPRQPDLSLVAGEAPKGAFFSLKTDETDGRKPDMGRLLQAAREENSADYLCLVTAEEIGIIEPVAITEEYQRQALEYRRQARFLIEKTNLDDSDNTLLEHLTRLETRIARRADLQRSIQKAYAYYCDNYWGNYSRREGQENNKLDSDLYLNPLMAEYEDSLPLASLKELREQAPKGSTSEKNAADAERIIRLLILDDVTDGEFIASKN